MTTNGHSGAAAGTDPSPHGSGMSQPIKAVRLRHPWRTVIAIILIVYLVAFVWDAAQRSAFQWDVFGKYVFDQRISAAEAYEWHLVEEVAEPGKAFDAAMALAAKVAAQPPLSVAMTKLTVNRLAHALDDLASHMDVDQFALASMSEDHKEGVDAFLGRRKPKFRGK